MLESLKSLLARWRVQVAVAGGALVVATAYGTCSYDPQAVSEVETTPTVEPVEVTTEETTTVPVSGTVTEDNTTTTTETTTTTTE
tara:strand:+ start:1095 stop:1349 length:255 start_codon:yes stop_codon:yes gene_type:complete